MEIEEKSRSVKGSVWISRKSTVIRHITCIKHCHRHFNALSYLILRGVYQLSIIFPIVQLRNMKLREILFNSLYSRDTLKLKSHKVCLENFNIRLIKCNPTDCGFYRSNIWHFNPIYVHVVSVDVCKTETKISKN